MRFVTRTWMFLLALSAAQVCAQGQAPSPPTTVAAPAAPAAPTPTTIAPAAAPATNDAPVVAAPPADAFQIDATATTAHNAQPVGLDSTLDVYLATTPDCGHASAYELRLDDMRTYIRNFACDTATKRLRFLLTRSPPAAEKSADATASADFAWRILLRYPWQRSTHLTRQAQVTLLDVVDEATPKVSANSAPIQLKLLSLNLPNVIAVLIVLAVTLMLLGGFRSRAKKAMPTFLRDGGKLPDGTLPSYSLARVQMAWWFGIIFAVYVILWIVTAEPPALTSSALWLMGISGATGLTSATMDANSATPVTPSQGFFTDLTSGTNGTGLHRLQLLAWTVFFGLVFITQAFATLAIPDFDSSILGLMGISSGTYLGFKVPETKSGDSKENAATAPAGAAATAATNSDVKSAYTAAPS